MKSAIVQKFISTAIAILAVTGIAKIGSAFGTTKLLSMIDPILGFQFRYVMIAVGISELGIALHCLLGRSRYLALALIGWSEQVFSFTGADCGG